MVQLAPEVAAKALPEAEETVVAVKVAAVMVKPESEVEVVTVKLAEEKMEVVMVQTEETATESISSSSSDRRGRGRPRRASPASGRAGPSGAGTSRVHERRLFGRAHGSFSSLKAAMAEAVYGSLRHRGAPTDDEKRAGREPRFASATLGVNSSSKRSGGESCELSSPSYA